MKWKRRYMEMAKHIAPWSKDDIGVGAIIYDRYTHRLISMGYNGVPRGVDESFVAFSRAKLHAEQNAILFARNSISNNCAIVVWPFMPCAICSAMIIQVGIREVIIPKEGLYSEKWQEDWDIARAMFSDTNIEVTEI